MTKTNKRIRQKQISK